MDIFLGAPFNILSYGVLLHIIGSIVGKAPRFLKASVGDAHIYENSLSAIKEQLERKSYPMMKFELPFEINSLQDLKFSTADDFMESFVDYKHHPSIKVDVCVG